jgi:hypothetical protein
MNDEKASLKVNSIEDLSGSASVRGVERPGDANTFAGRIGANWLPEERMRILRFTPYFIKFLKTSGRFDTWVEDCPMEFTARNRPEKRDVLGTILLSVLSGHWRYAHISAIRADNANPGLLGMTKVASEDSVRRALLALNEEESSRWMRRHLNASYESLLEEPWILDIDSTVKPLYGPQEEGKLEYNPTKPGRPSHVYHTHFIAKTPIVLEVEVQVGNQTATSYSQPGLWALLDGLAKENLPTFLRGDCNWGTEHVLGEAEKRNIPYVYKLKHGGYVKTLILDLFKEKRWVDVGQHWEGMDDQLQLPGWTKKRRVVAFRWPLRESLAARADGEKKRRGKVAERSHPDLPDLSYEDDVLYEYTVLVTSLTDEVRMIAERHRDRRASENNFNELKNQWAWAGFTTHDRKRCQIMGHIAALTCNWWTVFSRLGIPDQANGAIAS